MTYWSKRSARGMARFAQSALVAVLLVMSGASIAQQSAPTPAPASDPAIATAPDPASGSKSAADAKSDSDSKADPKSDPKSDSKPDAGSTPAWWDRVEPTIVVILAFVAVTGVILLLVSLIMKSSRGTAHDHAFGLPPGTIRGLIALSLVATFVVLAFEYLSASTTDADSEVSREVFVAVTTALATVLGFYFGAGGAKQAMQDMGSALNRMAEGGGGENAATSAADSAKRVQVSADRAQGAFAKLSERLKQAQRDNAPAVAMLQADVDLARKAVAKAAAAAASAGKRAQQVADLSRDLSRAVGPQDRTGLEVQIANLMNQLAADASTAEAQAEKVEKLVARHAMAGARP